MKKIISTVFLTIISLYSFSQSDAYNASVEGLNKFYEEDYIGAIAAFNKAIIGFKASNELVNLRESYYSRGNAKAELKDYRGAISDYTKGIEVVTGTSSLDLFVDAYYNRGIIKARLNDYKGAISDFDVIIKADFPYYSNGKVYYNRGISKIYINQKDEGCLDLSKAGELGYDRAYKSIQELCD